MNQIKGEVKRQDLPRKIWMLWFQGQENYPYVVQKCIDSWVRQNPSWEVVVLDSDTVAEYVNLNLPESVISKLSPNHHANLVRLALLSKYGGVWADATTYCVRPLDEWIYDNFGSGFFAFNKPGRDRLMSNWFMASEKKGIIVTRLYERLTDFLTTHHFETERSSFQRVAAKVLSLLFNRSTKTTKFWFTPFVTRIIRVYPYFFFHYQFERLVALDPEAKRIWESTNKISADGPHSIQFHGMLARPSVEIRQQINSGDVPLYKLSWKYDHKDFTKESTLHYLINKFTDIQNS